MVIFVHLQHQQVVVEEEEEEELVEMPCHAMPCHAMPAALRCACPVRNVRIPCHPKKGSNKRKVHAERLD